MIRLYSYKNNFGDDLSPYIISRLSGEEVVYRKPFSLSRFSLDFLRFLKKVLQKGVLDKTFLMFSPFNKVIISIGSILEESTPNSIVWGAGLGSRNIKIKGGEFLAVRGPLSQKRLAELGFNPPKVVGDPALLLPVIYPKTNQETKNKIGIIPHKSDFHIINEFVLKEQNDDLLVIDLVEPDLEKVINDFLSCDYILSSSLHGLIVAHSYDIPAIWFEESKLAGDGSKFIDYFSSVGINPYSPFKLDEFKLDIESIKVFFNLNTSLSLAKNNISVIQQNLLSVAPFKVKSKYQ